MYVFKLASVFLQNLNVPMAHLFISLSSLYPPPPRKDLSWQTWKNLQQIRNVYIYIGRILQILEPAGRGFTVGLRIRMFRSNPDLVC